MNLTQVISLAAMFGALYVMGLCIWDLGRNLWEARMSIFGNWGGGGGAWFSGDEQRRRRELLRQQMQAAMPPGMVQQMMQPFAAATVTAMSGSMNWPTISAWETPLLEAARETPVEMPAKIEPVALGELTNGMAKGDDERITRFL